MDNDKKLILFEIIITIIGVLILGYSIIFLNKDKTKEDPETSVLEGTPISEPISEEPSTANIEKITVQWSTQPPMEQENIIMFTTLNMEEVELKIEQNEVNPYFEVIDNLTDYEKELIYKITFAESGNQKEEGQRAVVEVILNRVLSNDFPDTVEGVLSQKHQFATWGIRNKVRQVDQDRIINILELVAIETPVLPNLEYVFFARGKQTRYATDFIKIQDHWFGAAK